MTGGVVFIVGIGVVLGIISGSFMLAVIFIIRHRYTYYTTFKKNEKKIKSPNFRLLTFFLFLANFYTAYI